MFEDMGSPSIGAIAGEAATIGPAQRIAAVLY
jgi:hypothetical protein